MKRIQRMLMKSFLNIMYAGVADKEKEDNVVLPRPCDSCSTSRARDREELETLGVKRTVELVAATSQRSIC
ncbi:hypothetical protein NDU88_008566 [Pleurodeles waltl]|uniref:Uncharacterized protein n=1 Tax=Pleurodeles waltl TaxID=8319 RepID=A0AAV7NEM7_PLEWA|nr:hypothetical protein NDU88_008566 [Pleurodeles waltl]